MPRCGCGLPYSTIQSTLAFFEPELVPGLQGLAMAQFDEVIHQPMRLRIMSALSAMPEQEGLDFSRLKKLTGASDGNLGAHIATLAKAGYVTVDKAFVARRPKTTVSATPAGRTAFGEHAMSLRRIIGSAPDKAA